MEKIGGGVYRIYATIKNPLRSAGVLRVMHDEGEGWEMMMMARRRFQRKENEEEGGK